jgi:small-conductance mechanosensitive channel
MFDTAQAAHEFSVFESRYLGQSVSTWIMAAAMIVFFCVVFQLLKKWGERKLAKPEDQSNSHESRHFRLRNLMVTLLSEIQPLTILLFSMYMATSVLEIPMRLARFLDRAFVLIFLIQAGIWGNKLILYWLENLSGSQKQTPAERSALMGILGFASRLAMWSVLVLIALNNFGIDITALIAGLGVGGLAVALAVQSILGDLFASLTIALDKPFIVGDSIQVDSETGVVEQIGLKTTRVRAAGGEQIIFSNADLLKSRIHNYKHLQQRRVVIGFGVTYNMTAEQLRRVPDIVRTLVKKHEPKIRFDRIHFNAFGQADLKFELVYFVLDSDYDLHMDIQQAILFDMFETFNHEKISFAQPTPTIQINSSALPSVPQSM